MLTMLNKLRWKTINIKSKRSEELPQLKEKNKENMREQAELLMKLLKRLKKELIKKIRKQLKRREEKKQEKHGLPTGDYDYSYSSPPYYFMNK